MIHRGGQPGAMTRAMAVYGNMSAVSNREGRCVGVVPNSPSTTAIFVALPPEEGELMGPRHMAFFNDDELRELVTILQERIERKR